MIEISNLQKNFGSKKAVDIEKYSIGQSEMLGLVGNNGAGKTTLFRLILDLLQADRGKRHGGRHRRGPQRRLEDLHRRLH